MAETMNYRVKIILVSTAQVNTMSPKLNGIFLLRLLGPPSYFLSDSNDRFANLYQLLDTNLIFVQLFVDPSKDLR